MPTVQNNTYSSTRVDPVFSPGAAAATQQKIKLKASTTFAAGTVMAEITATPGTYGPYASGGAGGLANPAGILQYGAVVDGSGNITNYSEWGVTASTGVMYIAGTFKTQDLVGLDANAITKLGGHVAQGPVDGTGTGLFTF